MKPTTCNSIHPLALQRTAASLLAIVALLSPIVPCSAQNSDLPYTSGSTGADGPLTIPGTAPARYQHAMAYDSVRQRIVLFGGYNNNGTIYGGGGWEWNGTTWETKSPGTFPAARYAHAMAYDAARQQVVLFGGTRSGENYSADTWVWDGTTWELKSPATSPPGRHSHALAYDSVRQRVVLFGGRGSNIHLADTWEWDGSTWAQKTSATAPASRQEHALAFDAARQRVVLFGGTGNSTYSDTWEWDGITWVQKLPGTTPGSRYDHTLAYDDLRQRVVLFGGYLSAYFNDTWEWDGTTWTLRSPANKPGARSDHGAAYDAARQRVVVFAGYGSTGPLSDTWEWNGTDWAFKAGSSFTFDMTPKANGVWNFTSITIPSGVTVLFKKNAANTPVTWLATEEVRIAGILDVSGTDAAGTNVPELVGKGGPGGFDGGLGGTRFDSSGAYFGLPGQGPGGGAAGTTSGAYGVDGTYRTTYGNVYLQPLIGGSGGGGGASNTTTNGRSGGGGGGAILIATSKDLVLTGEINAEGGRGDNGFPYGGNGSGGAVRLVADRVLGAGLVKVGSSGRIRLEGFYRELASASHSVTPSGAPPTATFATATQGQLVVSNIAGQPVPPLPTGSLLTPDVVFTQAGQITVTVTATNIPDGTPVALRISTSTGIITLPATGGANVTLSGGSAQFTTTVPAGLGSIQASAQYAVP